jgi:transcriptional regulator with XRE-family HTH domain
MSGTVHLMTGHVKSLKVSAEHGLRLARFRLMAERHLENLGTAIRRLRDEHDLSRSELGDKVGAHEKTVERWEKGTNAGAMEALPAIARELETTPDAIMALAVEVSEERDDAPPTATPEDRITRLERKMDAILAAVGAPTTVTPEPSLGEAEEESIRQTEGDPDEKRKAG